MKKQPQPHGGALIQAEKGEVLNPNGRPAGSRNRATKAREFLEAAAKLPTGAANIRQAFEEIGFKIEGIDAETLMTASQIVKAISGDTAAYNAVLNSAYGAPKQEVDNTQKVVVTVVRQRKPLPTESDDLD